MLCSCFYRGISLKTATRDPLIKPLVKVKCVNI